MHSCEGDLLIIMKIAYFYIFTPFSIAAIPTAAPLTAQVNGTLRGHVE